MSHPVKPLSSVSGPAGRVDAEDSDDDPATAPEQFRRSVASLAGAPVRPEVHIDTMRPPQRLAPWSHALSAEVRGAGGTELASGRLVLLYDPDGFDAWDGVLRLVAFASAELEPDIAADPLLPQVGWSWLTDALRDRQADHTAAGGTVTQTTSTRFGDLHGPRTSVALELRGSWTAGSENLQPHLLAFTDLLCAAAGLPPEGVSVLSTS
jgi:hypothetical protein